MDYIEHVFGKDHPLCSSNVARGIWAAYFEMSLAINVYEIGQAVKLDYERGTRHTTVNTTAKVVGSTLADFHGSKIGAAIGSKNSNAGAIIGTIVGGTIGGYFGGEFARRIAVAIVPYPEVEEWEEELEDEEEQID